MANSINFDGTNLGAYGLVITSSGINQLAQLESHVQLQQKGYPFIPMKEPRTINSDCVVTATSRANLGTYLDTIRRIVTTPVTKPLIYDILTGRYFNAMLEEFEGDYISPIAFKGEIVFICPDPVGHNITQTSSDHNIDADPKTVNEVTEGTAMIEPIYTLTAGENLVAVTIKVENMDNLEELQWDGSVANGEQLEIDVANWTVKNNGVASMDDVSGEFPRLLPNDTNRIKVTGFSNTGTLNILYRDTYL